MTGIRKLLPTRKRILILWILTGLFTFLLVSCGPVKLTLAHANLSPKGLVATPALIKPKTTLSDWQNELAPDLKVDIQEHIYGYLPDRSATRILEKRVVADSAFGELARVDEYKLTADAVFGQSTNTSKPFNMVVVSPLNAEKPHPVILMQTFCPNHATVPVSGVTRPVKDGMSCDGNGIMNGIMTYVFGRYIATPPLEDIVKRGYAVATIYPSEFVPDRSGSGRSALRELSAGHVDNDTRWGAIAAWAWGYSRMIDAIEHDPELETAEMFAYGHSRFGKSALVAAIFDERINGVVSHQSGTGGASLNKQKKGESIAEITGVYPHWFSQKYADYANREMDMPIDQHAVLALIAPRPVFLGNARRDVWSDPNGAFRASIGADPVYELYNKQGLDQDNLKSFKPDSEVSFFIRPGTHGVVKEDWPAFLDFLDAHSN